MDDFAAVESNAGHRNCSGGHAQIKAIVLVCSHGWQLAQGESMYVPRVPEVQVRMRIITVSYTITSSSITAQKKFL